MQQYSILVSEGDKTQWVYVDVAETDFNKVAQRIASEGFGITEPNPAGGNTAVWYPAGVIKRIEAAIP